MDANHAASRVIDYIQQYNLPQAGGALEAAMQKFPNHPSVQVAEAMYLVRTGCTAAAREKAETAATLNITQPAIVDALVKVLQQCCAWESLVKTYERLLPTQNARTVRENLVQTYARMGAYDALQTTATSLYREYHDPRYQAWMVQACLAQVPADSTDHLFLTLAARLLDAAVLTEKGTLTPTTVRTYVDVLAQQEKLDEAVTFLCSPRGSKIGLLETRLEVLAGLLERQGRHKLANAAAKLLWKTHPDNWGPVEVYKRTLSAPQAPLVDGDSADAVLTLESDDEALRATLRAAEADTSLESAIALAKALQAEEEQLRPRKTNRGPFLAELAFRAECASTPSGRADLDAAVLAYAQKLYTKPCCYLDISTFLTTTSAEAIHAWSVASHDTADDAEAAAKAELHHHTRRVLGLKCRVGLWGTTADTQPDEGVMRAVMRECREAYTAAKPLSATLAWSEEGLCDGYLSVAMSIALRGYVRDGAMNPEWLRLGLELQQGVDRRLNNPCWMIFAVGFANQLGLCDIAALHQLAFKSIQHDTMSHIGYWPLRRSLALGDIDSWEDTASDYYARVEQDCSLLRAKVFNYVSWPAMKDVQRFTHCQMNSVGRWTIAAHECASKLRTCQTQDNIVSLLQQYACELAAARVVLADSTRELLDNTDLLVVRSLILGNIHTDDVKALATALVPVPSVDERRAEGLRLLDSLLLLHDVAVLEKHRQTLAHAPKPRKATKKKAADHADPAATETKPTLYTPALAAAATASETSRPLSYLPAVAPVAKALEGFLQSGGELAVSAGSTDDLKHALAAVLEGGRPAFEAFFYPQAYLLAALVRTATLAKVPATAWATELRTTLLEAQSNIDAGSAEKWRPCAVVTDAASSTITRTLHVEKERRVSQYVADLLVDVTASVKRK